MRHDGPLSSLSVLASICFGPLQLSSLSSLSRCQLSFSWPRIFPLPLSFLIPHIISSQTLPILIQSKTITLRYSLQVRISSDDVRLWPIRSLNIDQSEAPDVRDHQGECPEQISTISVINVETGFYYQPMTWHSSLLVPVNRGSKIILFSTWNPIPTFPLHCVYPGGHRPHLLREAASGVTCVT